MASGAAGVYMYEGVLLQHSRADTLYTHRLF